MGDDRWSRVQAAFQAALDAGPGKREATIHRHCEGDEAALAEVRRLLDAHDRGESFLVPPALGVVGGGGVPGAAPTLVDRLSEGPGSRIGHYKLLQLIGEGGFGSVFMAEQEEPVRRRVAFKIIKLGMDTRQVVARFEQERQALALMDHPHIAKVLDAGATPTGRPFFVMELCKGEPITEYCDKGNLSIAERLDLFVQVCQAVQHAHQKGVIHRDIKPTNIMVSTQDGRAHAKVIDFGIAKATSARLTEKTLFTEHRQLIGTPEYMSPEQAEGSLDIDTRTDVYSLGVLLYELLTGSTPFDGRTLRAGAYAEMQRIIREVEPVSPSTRLSQSSDTIASVAAHRRTEPKRLGTIVRGDLDWIVMKALEKDRGRRYETANGLGADIGRYLAGEAVVAAPPSAVYRIGKFVRRNRVAVTAGGLVGAALVLGITGTSAGLVWALDEKERADGEARRATLAATAEASAKEQAQESEQRAQRDLARAREANAIIASMLSAARPMVAQGADTTLMRQILDTTAERIDGGSIADPLVEAEVRQLLGATYRDLAQYDQAESNLERSVQLYRDALGDGAVGTLEAMNSLAVLRRQRGRLAEAQELYERILTAAERNTGVHEEFILTVESNLGGVLFALGQLDEAEPHFRRAFEGRLRLLGEDNLGTINTQMYLASIAYNRGQDAEAEPIYRDLLARAERVLGPDHPMTASLLNAHAITLGRLGRLPEALELSLRSLSASERINGRDHPNTINARNSVVMAQRGLGLFADAEALARDNLAAARSRYDGQQPEVIDCLRTLATLLRDQNSATDEVESLAREAWERDARAGGPEAANTLLSLELLAGTLHARGRWEEAEALLRQLVEARRRDSEAGRSPAWKLFESQGELASLLVSRVDAGAAGDRPTALSVLQEAHSLLMPRIEDLLADPQIPEPNVAEDVRGDAMDRAIGLYRALHRLESDAGHADQAGIWIERLERHRALTRVQAPTPPPD